MLGATLAGRRGVSATIVGNRSHGSSAVGHAIEFHGRIGRGDGRLTAGRLDLVFRLHTTREGDNCVWEEVHHAVDVAPTGAFHVVLGLRRPLHADIFSETPRWLAVCTGQGDGVQEAGARVPLLGAEVQLADALRDLAERVDRLAGPVELPAAAKVDAEARRRIIRLHRRLRTLEDGGGVLGPLGLRVAAHETRLGRLDDDEDGRVIRLEDEIEDIVGPDGDIIDLVERVEALERSGGHGRGGGSAADDERVGVLAASLAAAEGRASRAEAEVEALSRRVAALDAALGALSARLEALSSAVPGPFTVQKGGVHLPSGGLQLREIEGRVPGASRRDGALFVNPRGGGDLVVGNRDSGSVLAAASLAGGRGGAVERVVAVRVSGSDSLQAGDVVALDTRRKVASAHYARPGEPPLGVVVRRAAVELGDGPVVVALAGVARVKVRGAVRPGDVLCADGDGLARVGDGPALGRALGASTGDSGTVDVHLFAP